MYISQQHSAVREKETGHTVLDAAGNQEYYTFAAPVQYGTTEACMCDGNCNSIIR